jgi:hypothetical protein
MYRASVYNVSNVPSHLRHLLESPVSAVLVIESEDAVISYFHTRESGGLSETDLIEFCNEIERAQKSLGASLAPTNRECAFIAHLFAQEYRSHGDSAANPLQQKQYYNEARKYDDVCDRYLKGLSVNALHSPSGNTIAYYVKGDSGYAYSLNASANSCTCHVGRNSSEICWHMRAVECFLAAGKKNERN